MAKLGYYKSLPNILFSDKVHNLMYLIDNTTNKCTSDEIGQEL